MAVGDRTALAALLYAADAASGGGKGALPAVAALTAPQRDLLGRAFAAAGGSRPAALPAPVSVLGRIRLEGAAPPLAGGLAPAADVSAFRRELAHLAAGADGLSVCQTLAWLEGAGLPWGRHADVPLAVGARCCAAYAEVLEAGDGAALVAGDLSGIQAFLYTVRDKGALRSLRARSFFLDLLVEDLQAELLARLGLSPACSVYAGGGRFYLLAPAATCRPVAAGVQREYERRLLAEYGGALGVVLACADLTGPADAAWSELGRLLGQAKLRRFADALGPAEAWEPRDPGPECAVCGREGGDVAPLGGDEETPACAGCRRFHEAGGLLPEVRAVVRAPRPLPGAPTLRLGDRVWSLLREDTAAWPADAEVVWRVRSGGTGPEGLADPRARPLDVAECSARGAAGQVLTLEELAAGAAGAQRIGTLHADVDHLGRVFRGGLPEPVRDLAHYAALSAALSAFFRREVPRLLRAPGRPLLSQGSGGVTLVYAGGDDLLLTGAWDAVAEAAFAIQGAFSAYAGNPEVTLSAGFIAAEAHEPLRLQALRAAVAEDLAKDAGRGRVTPLYSPVPLGSAAESCPDEAVTFTWEAARTLIREVAAPLATGVGGWDGAHGRLDPGVPRSVLHRLAELGRLWRDEGNYAFPQLYWLLARTGEGLQRRHGRDTPRHRAWMDLRQRLADTRTLRALPVLCTWLDLLARG